LKVRRITALWS